MAEVILEQVTRAFAENLALDKVSLFVGFLKITVIMSFKRYLFLEKLYIHYIDLLLLFYIV